MLSDRMCFFLVEEIAMQYGRRTDLPMSCGVITNQLLDADRLMTVARFTMQ